MTDSNHDRRPRRRRGRRRRGAAGQGAEPPRPSQAGTSAAPAPDAAPDTEVRGVFQATMRGDGFLRAPEATYEPRPFDPLVPRSVIDSLGLEDGVEVVARAISAGRIAPWVSDVQRLDGMDPQAWTRRVRFKDLVAETPSARIRLEHAPEECSTRIVDLLAPIGKGQRCLIVAPPKAGKTVLLQQMAHAVTVNHPEIHLFVLLVDERPEEVTDWRRTTQGEVIASSSDELARNHVRVAEIVVERSKRLVEAGRDVVVLLDSITRLSRAYNAEQRGSGRVLSGGIDARTMEKPRRLFGAARKVEGGGSLTVIATALVDTGSRMDEVIFQEFKGTGNTEIVMDRKLFDRRIFPSIDISQTGTRREEKLFTPEEYQRITILRRALAALRPAEAMQLLLERVQRHPTNAEFLAQLLS